MTMTPQTSDPPQPVPQHLPFTEMPKEVHEAAETLSNYFEKQGFRRWEFSHVADRRLVVELERQCAVLRTELENIASASPKKWQVSRDYFQEQFLPWAQNRARHAVASASNSSGLQWSAERPAVEGRWLAQRIDGTECILHVVADPFNERGGLWVRGSANGYWPVTSDRFNGWRWSGPR